MTLAPLLTNSRMVGVSRSIRVRSVILPSRTGTLRSARNKTRLPATSRLSSVRKGMLIAPPPPLVGGGWGGGVRTVAAPSPNPSRKGGGILDLQAAEQCGGVRHAVGEAPLVVVPAHHPGQRAIHHSGLRRIERAGRRAMVEVDA